MDPYVYPGTSILRNLRGIRDPAQLTQFEADATAERIAELEEKPIAGSFDSLHLRSIHRHIFQDVYDWAGEFRSVNIGIAGQLFAIHTHIAANLREILDVLSRERHLRHAGLAKFCSRGAYYLGEINAIHPFRDGNGRTQREFLRIVALHNGYILNWSRVSREQMVHASQRSFRADPTGMEEVLHLALDVESV